MSEYDEAVQRLKGYDDDVYLGFLCWYSIPENLLDHTHVVQEMARAGLQDFSLPAVPKGSDVFKRACSSNQRKNVAAHSNDRHNYLIRDTGFENGMIWRRLVRETVDMDGHTLGYVEQVEFEYDTEHDSVVYRLLDGDPYTPTDQNAAEIAVQVEHDFKAWNNKITAGTLRLQLRDIFRGWRATAARPSGGIYFVRRDHLEEVGRVEQFVGSLPDCNFHSLPLLDDTKQREMLKVAYENEGIGEVDRILSEIGEIMSTPNGRLTSERYAGYATRYKALTRKMADYSDLLDDTMEGVASRLEIWQAQMIKLMEHVQ